MTTHITTHNPVRSDVAHAAPEPTPGRSRAWALAGIGVVLIISTVSAIYPKLHAAGRAEAIVKAREAGYGRD